MNGEKTAETARPDVCLICMRPEEPKGRLVLAPANDRHPQAWLCQECQQKAEEDPHLAEEFRMISGLPHVHGCHRCAGSENPYFTFTMSLYSFLCRLCTRQLDDAEASGAALLRYLDDSMAKERDAFQGFSLDL